MRTNKFPRDQDKRSIHASSRAMGQINGKPTKQSKPMSVFDRVVVQAGPLETATQQEIEDWRRPKWRKRNIFHCKRPLGNSSIFEIWSRRGEYTINVRRQASWRWIENYRSVTWHRRFNFAQASFKTLVVRNYGFVRESEIDFDTFQSVTCSEHWVTSCVKPPWLPCRNGLWFHQFPFRNREEKGVGRDHSLPGASRQPFFARRTKWAIPRSRN